MKIFLSWSGERSGQIARGLRVWLTDVLHLLEPWVSSEDIDKGARWSLQLAQGLQSTSVGIVCLTPENLTSQWILFEAGALAKSVETSRVCTYLFQLRPTDIQGPLASFQATEATKSDTLRLLRMLNGLLAEHARPDDQLSRAFEKWWPEFEAVLLKIDERIEVPSIYRPDRELLEEILRFARQQERTSVDATLSWRHDYSGLQEFLTVDSVEVDMLVEAFVATYGRALAVEEGGDPPRLEFDSIDGTWISEVVAAGGTRAMNGEAKLIFHRGFLVGLDDESPAGGPLGPYLLVARYRDDGLFVGSYVNPKSPGDSAAWVGRITSGGRIDGQWKGGRWSFLRRRERT
jgi:hypothetical protein